MSPAVRPSLFLAVASLALWSLSGCSEQPPAQTGPQTGTQTGAQTESTETPAKPDEHAHEHPSEGPHGGSLVELGDEEYHAELVHDEKGGTVTIYILDGAAKNLVPIESTEITINLKHEGKAEQFKLTAKPGSDETGGKASRFESTEKELAADLDLEGAEPQLVLEIAGKQYRGKITHDHEGHDEKEHKHDEKEHKHGDEKDHKPGEEK